VSSDTTAEMTLHNVQLVWQLLALVGEMPHHFICKKIPWLFDILISMQLSSIHGGAKRLATIIYQIITKSY